MPSAIRSGASLAPQASTARRDGAHPSALRRAASLHARRAWRRGTATRRVRAQGSGGEAGERRKLSEAERSLAGATLDAEEAYEAGLLDQLFDLSGRVALVTGAAQGIGSHIAMGLARCGADVAVTDMGLDDKLEGVANAIRDHGRMALVVKCDVRERAQVEQAVEQAARELGGGRLDVLVANAGILGELEPAEHGTNEVWHDIFATNVDGVYNCCRAAYPRMRERGGSIIVMSSIAALRGFGPQVAYCASKGALLPLAKSLAAAWGKDNIRVNCILPGAINTQFIDQVVPDDARMRYLMGRIPLGRLGVGEDLVGPALFLASPPASAYVTGADLIVDGGGTILPMLVDQTPEAYQV